jgi:hypothetical protein
MAIWLDVTITRYFIYKTSVRNSGFIFHVLACPLYLKESGIVLMNVQSKRNRKNEGFIRRNYIYDKNILLFY